MDVIKDDLEDSSVSGPLLHYTRLLHSGFSYWKWLNRSAPVQSKDSRLCGFLPTEVEQWSSGGGDAVCWPAQQVKLCQGPGFLRLDVLQVEATHQEVLTPDVLWHQVHLSSTKRETQREGRGHRRGQERKKCDSIVKRKITQCYAYSLCLANIHVKHQHAVCTDKNSSK